MLKRLFLHYVAEETRPMLRLAIPLVLAELGWMTMAIVDTMMVGRQAHSAEAIGAVSLGSILFASAAIFGTGLMLGLDTLSLTLMVRVTSKIATAPWSTASTSASPSLQS